MSLGAISESGVKYYLDRPLTADCVKTPSPNSRPYITLDTLVLQMKLLNAYVSVWEYDNKVNLKDDKTEV